MTPSYPRVFIGLRELSGYATRLKQGFDQLGVDSILVNLSDPPHAYGYRKNPRWVRILNSTVQVIGNRFRGTWILRVLWIGLVQQLIGLFVLLPTLFTRDVFVFISVSTFFFFLELPLLKLFRKKVVYVFLGSDTRPTFFNGYVLQNTSRTSVFTGMVLTRIQKLIIAIVERYADVIINIPPQSHFHRRPILNGYIVGLPIAFQEELLGEESKPNVGNATVILHAPSIRGPKGTVKIRQMVEALREKGHSIEFVEISGRPNHEVIEAIRRCDFVIDELYSDMPMSTIAAEAAFWGRPTVVGGYYCLEIDGAVPKGLVPPSLFCLPEDVPKAIEKMIVDKEFRIALGQKAKRFVRDHWTAKKVAEKVIRAAMGDCPKEWFFDPNQIDYALGCGLREDQARDLIREFIRIGGMESFGLRDKPKLEQAMQALLSEPAQKRNNSMRMGSKL